MNTRVAIIAPTLQPVGCKVPFLTNLIDLIELQRNCGGGSQGFTPESELHYEPSIPTTPCGRMLSDGGDLRHSQSYAGDISVLADRLAGNFERVEFHGLAPPGLLRTLDQRIPTVLFLHRPDLTCPSGTRYLPAGHTCCTARASVSCIRCDLTEHCLSQPDGVRFSPSRRIQAHRRAPLSREISRLATCLVFNSEAHRRLFERTVEPPQFARVLPPKLPDVGGRNSRRDAKKLLFIGSLERGQGILDAVRAAAAISQSTLDVIGTGSVAAEAKALSRNLGSNVVFHGEPSSVAVKRFLHRAGYLVLPPLEFEAWGLVGPMAIAAGCPVAAYDNGGIREWLIDGAGALAKSGDIPGLASAVAKVSGDGISRETVRRLDIRFGKKAFAQRYGRILTDVDERFALRRKPVVLHVQRRPLPGYQSIEVLFESIRAGMPAGWNIQVREAPFQSRGMWRRILNCLAMRKLRADVYHVTGDAHYLGFGLPGRKTLQTIHDCVFHTRTTGLRHWLIKTLYYVAPVGRAALTSCISKSTRADVASLTGVAEDTLALTPNCISPEYVFVEQVFREAKPEVLLVGTRSHKNQRRVIAALAGLDVKLHVVGRLDEPLRRSLDRSKLEFRNSIDLPLEQMVRAYVDCDLLVFASTFEGFGMPVIEAQTVGRPVVASNVSSLPEITGQGGLLVDPESETEIRTAVRQICSDAVLREALIQAGRKNATQYRPTVVAQRYAQLYQKLLDG